MKEKESQSEEDGHQSKLINPNSIMSEDNSLISDNKKINNLTIDDRKKIDSAINRGLGIRKEDYINFDEISIKKSLFFRLFISGTIEYGNFTGEEPIKVNYEFVSGEKWAKEDGLTKGSTQYSCKGEGIYNYYSYGLNFEISYRSTDPFGWPQLVLNCFTVDLNGNEIVKGYGVVHVPTSTGRHKRRIHIFRATENSNFFGKLFGYNSSNSDEKNDDKTDPKVISSGQEREISRANCEGFINVVFQVVFRDVDKFGLVIK
jgi:B9 domain-containing protein 1